MSKGFGGEESGKFWISLRRGESFAASRLMARTADPVLVWMITSGLYDNWLLEGDRGDVILDPSFIASAPAIIADLKADIRREAIRGWPGEEAEGAFGCRPPAGGHGQGRTTDLQDAPADLQDAPADIHAASDDRGDDPSGRTSAAAPEQPPADRMSEGAPIE